jgi:predicted double-glycine peptidase
MKALRPITRTTATYSAALLSVAFLLLPVVRPKLFPIQVSQSAAWKDGICMQSHEASCGPAAAATLLHQAAVRTPSRLKFLDGSLASAPVDSAEWMMARACLTSRKGTSSQGLVRGLRMAVSGSDRSVEVASSEPAAWTSRRQLPNIAVISFRQLEDAGPVTRLLGAGDEGHAVVVHSRLSDGRWLIADPAVGWRRWSDEEFRRVFTGEAIYLAACDHDR